MFQLLINGEAVDLSPNSSISIDEESPIFNQDDIPGGFSFPFELPTTPKNNRILGFAGRVQSRSQGGKDSPFQLFNNGRYIGSGTATVQKATDLAYSAFLQVSTGSFAGKITGKKMSDLNLGGVREWIFKPEFVYPKDDFALFPIYNTDFLKGTEFDGSFVFRHYPLNHWIDGDWYQEEGIIFAVTPFPYLAYVIQRVFENFNIQLEENILATDPDFKGLCIYNNHDSAKLTYVTTPVTKFGYDNTTGTWHTFTVNTRTISRGLDTFNLVDHLPDMLISDFILSIRNMFNLAFVVTPRGTVRIKKRQDLIAVGSPVSLADKYIGRPLVTVSTDVKGVYLRWTHEGNDLLFSEGFKDIFDHSDLIFPSVPNIAALHALVPTANEIRLVENWHQYFQFAPETVDGVTTYSWILYSNDFQDMKIGTDPEEFTTQASTLPMIHYQRIPEGCYIRCPQAQQQSSSIIRTDSLPCTLRLLFYRGMTEDSNGDLYPYGSSDAFDPDGNLWPGASLSLKWQGETGLYEQLWKGYLEWWKTRKSVTWTILDPSILDFMTIYEIESNHYILKRRTLTIESQGPVPGDCEFYLV